MRRTVATLLASALVALVAAVGVAPAAEAAPAGGYDDWSCRPSAAHPEPVVLLHGLGGDPESNFAYLGPALAAAGHCVFAAPYSPPGQLPFYGLDPIDEAAADVVAFIGRVLSATGAREVDLVGHSEGGFLSLYVPKVHGLASKVRRVVALAPPTHGVTFFGLVALGQATGSMPMADQMLRQGGCGACADLVDDGAAVQRLNAGPIAQVGIRYTVIATRTDVLVRNLDYRPPTETAFVREPGVTNRYVQDRCPLNPVGHLGLAFDPTVLGLVREAIDARAPRASCAAGLPL